VVGELGAFSWVRLRLWWERAFWVVPLGGVVGGTILSILISDIDDRIAAAGGALQLIAAAQASQLLSAIGGGMITFTGSCSPSSS
jgi:uncharacterized membrane protein